MPRTKDHNNGILWQYILSLCPKIHNTRSIAWKYVFREILIPSVAAYLDFRFSRLALNADIIVSALGVLGGLLFAHAIFVFELRMTYNANLRERIRNKEIQAENTKLTRLIRIGSGDYTCRGHGIFPWRIRHTAADREKTDIGGDCMANDTLSILHLSSSQNHIRRIRRTTKIKNRIMSTTR